eukprot:Gb_04265 [translate_table: standard]
MAHFAVRIASNQLPYSFNQHLKSKSCHYSSKDNDANRLYT